MKKTIIFSSCVIISLFINAHDFIVDGIFYKIIGNEVAVTHYGSSLSSAYYYNDIVIPESVTYEGTTYPVTSIDDYAFYQCSGLTSVVIPNSVLTIGESAFRSCTQLDSIVFPNSVVSIGDNALDRTLWLNNQPEGLVYAGTVAYQYKGTMPDGTSISLKDGTKGISNRLFINCTALSSIELPNTVLLIGDYAFYGCSELTNIEMSTSLINIGYYAFGSCSRLNSINLPNSIKNIASYAFSGCSGLKSLVIPNSLDSIRFGTFKGCSGLTRLVIPNTIKCIQKYSFEGCDGLTNISVENDNPFYDSRNNCNAIIETANDNLIVGCKNTLIPNTVISIGESAFQSCAGITRVIIPNSVKTIGNSAFRWCRNLKKIKFLGDIDRIEEYAFNHYTYLDIDELEIYGNIKSIGKNAFTYSDNGVHPRNTYLIIFGSNVDSIKALNVMPYQNIYCLNPIPPEAEENTFKAYYATLHVPASSLAAYFVAPIWTNFNNIKNDAVELIDITLTPDTFEMHLGDEPVQLSIEISPSNALPNNFHWISTNTNVLTVENGVVSAIGVGECDIIVECLNKYAFCHVIVKETPNVIMLDQHEARIKPNEMIILIPTSSINILPNLAVASSDPTVAVARVVNEKIQVVGVNPGIATITVGSVDGTAQADSCVVTVYSDSIKGDVNGDGEVNIADINAVIDMILSGNSSANGDVNNDGEVNIADINTIIDMILNQSFPVQNEAIF